jgi:hypothetical protein
MTMDTLTEIYKQMMKDAKEAHKLLRVRCKGSYHKKPNKLNFKKIIDYKTHKKRFVSVYPKLPKD